MNTAQHSRNQKTSPQRRGERGGHPWERPAERGSAFLTPRTQDAGCVRSQGNAQESFPKAKDFSTHGKCSVILRGLRGLRGGFGGQALPRRPRRREESPRVKKGGRAGARPRAMREQAVRMRGADRSGTAARRSSRGQCCCG